MSRRSRRGKRKQSPLRSHWLSIAIISAIIVIAVGGGYAYVTRGSTTTQTSSSSSSTSSSAGTGNYAVLDTSQGTIVIQLFPQDAPKTVANFESLANSGFYNNLVWHRIVAGFVIQTGDPNTKGAINSTRSTWGTGGSSTTIPFENSTLANDQGYVAMARGSSINSASSQFYINLVNNPSLTGQYAVFGKVVSGMSVVNAIAALPVYTNSATYTYDQPINAQGALLISVTIQSTA
jgi:cyclophilin family peptidyl-prolyl cis-trans isomerase